MLVANVAGGEDQITYRGWLDGWMDGTLVLWDLWVLWIGLCDVILARRVGIAHGDGDEIGMRDGWS